LKGKRNLVSQFRQVVDIGAKYPACEKRTKSPANLGPGSKVWVKSKRRDLGGVDCGSEGMNEFGFDSLLVIRVDSPLLSVKKVESGSPMRVCAAINTPTFGANTCMAMIGARDARAASWVGR
jgi:hypothetical protein